MKPNKKNPFFVPGIVHTSEYDWKSQFHVCALEVYKNCEVYRVFDVGKVLGLTDYVLELEEENKRLVKATKEPKII